MSAGRGPGDDARPGDGLPDDALPEDFTVPDDLSALFDAPDAPPTAPAAGPGRQAEGEPSRAAEDAGPDGAAPGGGAADAAPGAHARDDAPAPAAHTPAGDASDGGAAGEVPDDVSSLTDPAAAEPPSVTLVLTQVAAAGPLAAACALAGVDVDVVPSPVGALAVLRDARTGPAGAEAISKLLKTVPVILLERRSGQITATRWAGGQKGDELPAGLVLSDAPAVLEDLLLGGASVADLDGVVTSVGLSRWKAMRLLAQSARGKRG